MKELEGLYKELQPKIYAFFYVKTLNRSVSEDLTHDVFYEAIKGLHSFSGQSSLQTWVFSIARNLLKKHYRTKKYASSLTEKLTLERERKTDSPEELYLFKEGEEKCLELIHQFDEGLKEIVILRLYGELSFKEIGDLTEKSENYVRVSYHRAKLKLQKEMRENDE